MTVKATRKALRELGITAKDIQVYNYIQAYISQYGCSPSYREIAANTGAKYVSTGQWRVERLIDKGYIAVGRRPSKKGLGRRVGGSMRLTNKRPEWNDWTDEKA